MTTADIMQLALDMAGFTRIPEDSGIYVSGDRIRRVLFGVDVGTAELQMAKSLGYDLVIAHHPPGTTPDQWKLLRRHIEFMTAAGVPEDAAKAAVADRVEATRLRGQVANFDHTPSAARLLAMPYMNIHAPLDELGRRIMREAIDRVLSRSGPTVGDVVRALAALPEVAAAPTQVQIMMGDAEHPARNVVVAHGALTNGGYAVARTCFAHGVDTVIYIHVDFGELQRLRSDAKGNLIIVGHLAGDSLGFTPFLNALRERRLEVTTFSGAIDPRH